MTCSNIITLGASVVSVLMIPVAAWVSHVFAVREFRAQQVEAKVDRLCEGQRQLDHDLTFTVGY
jgi:hypothetical protein